ncbi:hypothetical protein O9929_12840 [Vibrio lentus]|nr:hypothetical protein [Vibrio lentus]
MAVKGEENKPFISVAILSSLFIFAAKTVTLTCCSWKDSVSKSAVSSTMRYGETTKAESDTFVAT